jgi:hypothetical protein
MAALTVVWLMVGLLYEFSIAPELLHRWEDWFEGAMWFTIAFLPPLVIGVATVLLRAGICRRGFLSRGRRLQWHLLGALVGALSFAIFLAQMNPPGAWLDVWFVIVTAAAWLVIFPMLYGPRLLMPSLSGLDDSVGPPVMPSSPR